MQQQGIVKGDLLQKVAGLSFVVGAVLLIVFNVLFPKTNDPSSAAQFVQSVADTRGGRWELVNLFLAVGIWGLLIGFAGVYRAISTGSSAVWARLGFYGVIVGTALWTVLFGLQGFGLSLVVKQWQSASGPTKDALAVIAASHANMLTGLFSMTIIVFWLALIFIGIGMASSKVFPRWLGWVAIVLGVVTAAAVGVNQAFAGPTDMTINVLFPIFAMLSTIYALILGIWLLRKAW